LVFSKRAHYGAASSPSSPEDNGNGFAKSKVLAIQYHYERLTILGYFLISLFPLKEYL